MFAAAVDSAVEATAIPENPLPTIVFSRSSAVETQRFFLIDSRSNEDVCSIRGVDECLPHATAVASPFSVHDDMYGSLEISIWNCGFDYRAYVWRHFGCSLTSNQCLWRPSKHLVNGSEQCNEGAVFGVT